MPGASRRAESVGAASSGARLPCRPRTDAVLRSAPDIRPEPALEREDRDGGTASGRARWRVASALGVGALRRALAAAFERPAFAVFFVLGMWIRLLASTVRRPRPGVKHEGIAERQDRKGAGPQKARRPSDGPPPRAAIGDG